MKNKIVYLILIISIAFNLSFVAMFVWHRLHAPKPPVPREFRHVREHLGDTGKELRNLRRDLDMGKREFIEHLHGDQFDETVADTLLSRIIGKQIVLEKKFGKKLIELRKKGILPVKPEQDPPGFGRRPEKHHLKGERNEKDTRN